VIFQGCLLPGKRGVIIAIREGGAVSVTAFLFVLPSPFRGVYRQEHPSITTMYGFLTHRSIHHPEHISERPAMGASSAVLFGEGWEVHDLGCRICREKGMLWADLTDMIRWALITCNSKKPKKPLKSIK